MTIIADASALIAIITGESDADMLANTLEADDARRCSAVSVREAMAGLRRSHSFTVAEARSQIDLFLNAGGFRFVNIGEREWKTAAEPFAAYGKERHPAAHNMGDCFAHACARSNQAKPLYKGDDFEQTDLG